jgi:hypothetical protein
MARLGAPPPDDPDADAPEWYRKSAALRRVPIVAAIVLGVVIVQATTNGSSPPALRTSCTTPAFALSTYSAQQHKAVRWAMTGKPGVVYQLAVGVDRFDAAPNGRLTPVPPSRAVDGHAQLASPQVKMDADCKADGTFGVLIEPGRYTAALFAFTGTRASPTSTRVATRTFTVTRR